MKKFLIFLPFLAFFLFPNTVDAKQTDLSKFSIIPIAQGYHYVSTNHIDWISLAIESIPVSVPHKQGFVIQKEGSTHLFAYIAKPYTDQKSSSIGLEKFNFDYYANESACDYKCLKFPSQKYYLVEIDPENKLIVDVSSGSSNNYIYFSDIIQTSAYIYRVRSTTGEVADEQKEYSSRMCMNVTDTFGDEFNVIRSNEVPSFQSLPEFSSKKYYTLVKSSNKFYFLYFTDSPLSVTRFQTHCYDFFRLNLKNESGVFPWDDPAAVVYMFNDTTGIANGWEKVVRNPTKYNYFDSYIMIPDRAFKNPDHDWGDDWVLPYFNNRLNTDSKTVSFSNWVSDTSIAYSVSTNYDVTDSITGTLVFPKDNIDFTGSPSGGNTSSDNTGGDSSSGGNSITGIGDLLDMALDFVRNFLGVFTKIGEMSTLVFSSFPPVVQQGISALFVVLVISVVVKVFRK